MEYIDVVNEKLSNLKEKFEDHEDRISEVEDRTSKMDVSFQVSFAKTSAALEKLAELPQAISSMQKTNEEVRLSLVQLSGKVDNLGTDVGKLDRKVCSLNDKVNIIDEDGKFSWRKFIKDNWVKIVVGVGVLLVLGSYSIQDIINFFG